jgi:transcription initiation factor TFIIH subunit 4
MSRGSLFKQLQGQPRVVLDKLYEGLSASGLNGTAGGSHWACKAVFQSLSQLAKCLVMKLLFVQAAFSCDEFLMSVAADKSALKQCRIAWEELVAIRIVVDEDASGTATGMYRINPTFQKSLQSSLSGPTEPWSTSTSASKTVVASTTISTVDLDRYSTDKWNEVLGYLVNLLPTSALPSNILTVFVKRAGLMAEATDPATNKRGMKITARGYEYMLKDYLSQVWDFVMVSIKHSTSQEDALSLLFTLSYCTFGRGYPIDALSKVQQQLVFEFSQVGIVFMPSITSPYFYPSRVAINMIFGASDALHGAIPSSSRALQNSTASHGAGVASTAGPGETAVQSLQIIVETNNQVVAYLTNDIHLAMLQLFVEVIVRMPNMAIGKITKEKVRGAFKMGIKASQIVDFLVLHAHPQVRRRAPVIPENVTDELALWEAELQRISAVESCVIDFREFSNISKHEFGELVSALTSQGVVLWSSEEKVILAVTPEGVQLVRSYLQRHRPY